MSAWLLVPGPGSMVGTAPKNWSGFSATEALLLIRCCFAWWFDIFSAVSDEGRSCQSGPRSSAWAPLMLLFRFTTASLWGPSAGVLRPRLSTACWWGAVKPSKHQPLAHTPTNYCTLGSNHHLVILFLGHKCVMCCVLLTQAVSAGNYLSWITLPCSQSKKGDLPSCAENCEGIHS